jgi:hypothetical protein
VVLGRRNRRKQLSYRAGALGLVVGVFVATGTFAGLTAVSTAANATTATDPLRPQTVKASSSAEMTFGTPEFSSAPMPDLEVTVSQTQGLLSQAVEVSWKGAKPSELPNTGTGGVNYLQIAECWGEDPANPGHPDRTTCQYGGFGSTIGATRGASASCHFFKNANNDYEWAPASVNPKDYPYTTGSNAGFSGPCKIDDADPSPVTTIPFRYYSSDATAKQVVAANVFSDPVADPAGTGPRVGFETRNDSLACTKRATRINVVGAKWANGVATYTTAGPHGFTTGMSVTVSDVFPGGYNVVNATITVPAGSTNTFTAALTTDPGTFTASPNALAAQGSTYNGIQKSNTTSVCGGYFDTPIPAKVQLPQADGSIANTDVSVESVDTASTTAYTQWNTNEVPWAGSSDAGVGSAKFEIQTNTEAPWLGCGSPYVDPSDNITKPKPCWLVVIPRGTHDLGTTNITKSGLWWDAWEHNLAFKLDFKPTAQRCGIGSAERQLAGTELVLGAVSSWQPKFCSGAAASAFVYSVADDSSSVTRASGKTLSPLAFTSAPLATSGKDPVVYAPVALTGLTISFAVDKYASATAPAGSDKHNREPFTSMKLTPRLVAKLLTNSYKRSLPIGVPLTHLDVHNADELVVDPDFLSKQDSDEWRNQFLLSVSLADLLVPGDPSYGATQLWKYAMSDQEGRDFLAGKPDEQGMKVNPYYSSVASPNPYYKAGNPASGEPTLPANTLPYNNFPKADPSATKNTITDVKYGNDSVNLLTYRPPTKGFADGAYLTLRGDGQILNMGSWNALKKVFDKQPRSLAGTQKVLAVSSLEAATRYHNVTASLRNPAGNYVSATTVSVAAAAAVMTPVKDGSSVVGLDYSNPSVAQAKDAYPLAMPVYAAVNPLQQVSTVTSTATANKAALTSYANVIRYAVTDGQIPGVESGQLPPGYVPIPSAWKDQALKAATAIEQGISPLSVLTVAPRSVPTVEAAAAPPSQQVASPPVATAPSPAPSPTKSAAGTPVTSLAGKPTPADPALGPVAVAVPAGMVSGLAAAAAVPLYTRFRRRI